MGHRSDLSYSADDALRNAVRSLHRRAQGTVTFGGRVHADALRLTQFVGVRTSLLRNLVVRPDTGAGGRSWTQRRLVAVDDYRRSKAITHEYDGPVGVEGIRALVAAPVVVRGEARAVLYLGAREDATFGDRTLGAIADTASSLAHELEVQDEVARRLAQLRDQMHAELRSLAASVADTSVRERLNNLESMLDDGTTARPVASPLSARETDVLALVAFGCSYAEVASRLMLSPQSVKTYMRNVLAKLGAHNRHEAVVTARKLSLI